MATLVELFAQMSVQRAGADLQSIRGTAKLRTPEPPVELLGAIQFVMASHRGAFDRVSHEDRSDAAREFWALGPSRVGPDTPETRLLLPQWSSLRRLLPPQ